MIPSYSRTVSLACLSFAALARAQTTECISVDASGVPANANAGDDVALSADGRYVVFGSAASNLVPGDTNNAGDTFLRDRLTGTTVRVSVDSAGAQAANGALTEHSAISADGTTVAFESVSANLVAGDTNGFADIFVRDLTSGQTTRVSVDSLGVEANGLSTWCALSADGRFAAFASLATNLVANDTNGSLDVFLHDRVNGLTRRISVTSLGSEAHGDSGGPALSADASRVAFWSQAPDLVPGDVNNQPDIFVHDWLTGATQLVSRNSQGVQGSSTHFDTPTPLAISGDGRCVAFTSSAENLVAGDNNFWMDVFVRDVGTGLTMRASIDTAGGDAGGFSLLPALSFDGRFCAFLSRAADLVPGDTNAVDDVFVFDRASQSTVRVSLTSAGAQGFDLGLSTCALDADARRIAFIALSPFVPNDANAKLDVFVRDLGPQIGIFCAGHFWQVDHASACPCGNNGALGRGCAHSADPRGAELSASGTAAADDVVLRAADEPANTFTQFQQHDARGDQVFEDGVLCAGGNLVRLRGRNAAGGEAFFPDSAFASDNTTTLSQRGGVFAGQGVRRYYSAWFRNPSSTFCPPATSNVTNGVYVDW